MKLTLNYLFLAVMFLMVPMAFGQKTNTNSGKQGSADQVDTRIDNMQYWMKKAEQGLVPYNPVVPIEPAVYKGSRIAVRGIKTTNSPDVPVTLLTDVTESENSVFVDPANADYILNSNNSTSWSGGSVGSLYGANYFQSSNAGIGWVGTPQGAGGANSGDPTTAIGLNGREYINFIDDPGGQGIAWSDDGVAWSTATVVPNPGSLADKNHMWIDNKPTSPYEGNLYVAWTDFGGADDTEIKISRSVNDGAAWSSPIKLSTAINAGSHNQGVNIQTGPNGQVYVCWAIYDSWPSDETAIGFAKSTDGGATYGAATRIISNIKGIRTTTVSKNHRVNSFPVMAVDISGGPYNGYIYIIWTNIGFPRTNTGTNASVYMIRSSDGGDTWSTPIRVNQGPNVDGKKSYFPWITCDPETGELSAVFYDDRNVSTTECEAWAAYSTDAGTNWTDFAVSDVAFTPTPITGLASSYMGDYLGITARAGKVYPCWIDTRNGLFMTYVSPFELGLNASFTANLTTVCTGSSVTFTDVSSGPPTSWNWSFPGGNPSSFVGKTPPSIQYTAPGTYDVSLTVSDGVTTDTETKTGYITVKDVIANFSGVPTSVVVGNNVTFTDNSACGPATWEWSFPGGTPSTYTGQTPPAINYSTLGTYDVALTVTKPGSTDTKTRPGYITVAPPVFNMTNGTVTTCTGDFYDSGGSTGAYQNNEVYVMTFYPGTPGAMIRFNFTSFNTELNYDTLTIYNGINSSAPLIGKYHGTTGPGIVTATNGYGALTFRFRSDVSLTYAGWAATITCNSATSLPVADFSASTVTPPMSQTVTFTDQTSNIPSSWSWSFSPSSVTYVGGTSSTSQNPQVQFNATGPYTVTLTATNAFGSDTKTKTNYINVTAPVYLMTNGSVTTCSGDFYDSGGSSGVYQNNETYIMTFYPSTPGTMIRFNFTSFATESGYDTLTIYNGVNSGAPLIGKYHGSTGPGIVTASGASGALTFRFHSDGYVTGSGWAASISCYSTTTPPVADFSASALNPLVAQTVTFSDLSINAPASWLWTFTPSTVTFVNGTTATSQNPQVQFSALGQYTVGLTATNSYGSDSEVKSNFITVTNCSITSFPWNEGFENSGVIPTCWTQEQVNNSGINWTFINGNGNGYPANAHSGTYNACLQDATSTDNKTRLISPVLNLASLPNPQLSFWHTQTYWSPDQDQLSVFYKTSAGGTWTLLTTYTASLTIWTQETISLPNATATYYIAFEGNAKWGRGVCVDDVQVASSCTSINPVSVSIGASANPVTSGTSVTFTAVPVNGGATPAYQWKVNAGNANSATNSTYTYAPVNGDVVTCVLTSSDVCVSGNPATSNAITMTVTSVPAIQNLANVNVTLAQCFDAMQTIYVAGGSNFFAVQPTGIATMVAGQNIVMYPGTSVLPGGYLHAYIAPSGPFCPPPTKESDVVSKTNTVTPVVNFFRVYPNPTSGEFTLALNGYVPFEPVSVVVYDMKGDKITSAVMTNEMKHTFSLAGYPAGLYLVVVNSGYQNGSLRIVKAD